MSEAPFATTPFTEARRLFSYELQIEPNSACAKIEVRYNDCVDAYGLELSRTKCKQLREDLHECVHHTKMIMRNQIMKRERERQYKAGERKQRYEDPPPRDIYIWSNYK